TAATLPLSLSMAIAEGSSMIRPRPAMWISVLTVPRSIATPVRNRIESRPQHEMPVSPPPVWLLIQGCGSSGAEVTEVGARLGRGRRGRGVVAPGGHGGHVGAGLALEFLPRGLRVAPRLPCDHPFQPLVERLEVSGLVGAEAAVPAGFDGHAAAFAGGRGHGVLLGICPATPQPLFWVKSWPRGSLRPPPSHAPPGRSGWGARR